MARLTGTRTSRNFTAGGTIAVGCLVKLSGAEVVVAAADDAAIIGINNDAAVAITDTVTIELFWPTYKIKTGEAVDAGDPLYVTTGGVVVDTDPETGGNADTIRAYALAAAASGALVECAIPLR